MRASSARQVARLLVLALLWPGGLLAFAHAQIGDSLDNAEMPVLEGGKQALLGEAAANVFVFVKPGSRPSEDALRQLGALERETHGKSVHWVAIVSDKIPKSTVQQSVTSAGIRMPVLIDVGDALYAKLGVILYPSIGIADKEHKLASYEYFKQVDYAVVVRARIRYLLKEIDEQEQQNAIAPLAAGMPTNDLALRHLHLGQKLLDDKRYDQAIAQAKKSVEKDAKLAAAHVLLGESLLAGGQKAEALKAFEQALQLDSQNAKASAGKKACAE